TITSKTHIENGLEPLEETTLYPSPSAAACPGSAGPQLACRARFRPRTLALQRLPLLPLPRLEPVPGLDAPGDCLDGLAPARPAAAPRRRRPLAALSAQRPLHPHRSAAPRPGAGRSALVRSAAP